MDPAELWDAEAARFDEEPDHGLRDTGVRAAWRELLLDLLPPAPARVADLGCGTGTLAVLLAQEGYTVDGLDLSSEMLARAEAKASLAGVEIGLVQGDAAVPDLDPASYDVVLCRHVLWAMPEPGEALRRWCALLRPGGVAVLVEGRWSAGGGLTADQVADLVRAVGRQGDVRRLPEARFWGRDIDDERFVVVARP